MGVLQNEQAEREEGENVQGQKTRKGTMHGMLQSEHHSFTLFALKWGQNKQNLGDCPHGYS